MSHIYYSRIQEAIVHKANISHSVLSNSLLS